MKAFITSGLGIVMLLCSTTGSMGKYGKDGSAKPIMGHSMTMAALGVFILWLGWFGFNPDSTTTAGKSIAMIFVNTNLAAAAGAIVAMFTSWIKFGKPEIGMNLNGVLAGLVAITADCANVMPGSAVIIGAVARSAGCLISRVFRSHQSRRSMGAISVHGINGAWGTLAAGLFNMGGTSFFPSSAYSCWVSWRVSPGPSPWHLACLS